MGNPTATLERENLSAMKLEASHLDEAERPKAAMKFTYPSGSRPLDGYVIKRGVGRGGFGEVYFATSDAGKEVALKLIRRNLEVELRGVTQCLNLKHPNLIALYDIRTDEMGDQWVIMEYVAGESLEDAIDRYPNGMPVDQLLWWLRGMCAGVAYLHDHGIVHRDLKPGNIFCDEGTVKIGDYGLAKFISCSRRSGQTESVGTVHYMAPEIANGRYGREIDTYALGIILFEMLTGRVPFEGESVGEVLMKHLTAEPDLSAIAEPYQDIVRRALAKDPNVRLKNVGELVALLPGGAEGAGAAPATSFSGPRHFGRAPDASNAAPEPQSTPANEWTARYEGVHVDEPIAHAVREAAEKFRGKWYGEGPNAFNSVQRMAMVFAVVFGAYWFFDDLLGVAITTGVIYLIYRAIWENWLRPKQAGPGTGQRTRASLASKLAANGAAAASERRSEARTEILRDVKQHTPGADRYAEQARRRKRPNWRERAMQELAAKPKREKVSELLGSMLLAALFASLAALIAPLLLSDQSAPERVAAHLWLATVGTLGSWAILVPAKFAEGKLEDQVPMRLVLLGLGALVGVAGWFLGDVLLMQMPNWGEPVSMDKGLLTHELLRWARTPAGASPTLVVYVTYFAFLFLLLRWWRQAEFTRSSRLSLWSVAACVFSAWLLQLFWWFPQPIGMMVAGVIAVSTQLASPWLPPSRRRALAAQGEVVTA